MGYNVHFESFGLHFVGINNHINSRRRARRYLAPGLSANRHLLEAISKIPSIVTLSGAKGLDREMALFGAIFVQ